MARDEELWDDSALINAFNNALSNYKVMHNQGGEISSSEQDKSTPNDEILEPRGVDIEETSNIIPIKERCDPEKEAPSLDEQNTQEFLNSQSVEDYNQLLAKYYEIEDQRQKVLQQLYQFCYSGEQNIDPITSTSEEHQAYANQTSYSSTVCSCCPYGCQISVANSTSVPTYGPGALWNDKIINNTEVKETKSDELPESSSNETDLNEVINAWYKAGLYTGKYLAEQKK